MDKFSAMQAFVRVVEAGNFTKAADTLDMPKPTVTRLIQTLEAHLRTRLLNRTTRRVTVTPDGAAYYDRAVRLLSEVDELESSMSQANANPRGRLRVDVGSSVARLLVIPALQEFHDKYPEIQLDLGVSDRSIDLLSENVDCVLRAGALADESLVARRIGEFHFFTAASPRYVKRRGLPRHPQELEDQHHVVGYFNARTGKVYPFDFSKDGERIEVTGRYQVAVNDSNAYVTAGLNGLGIVQTASFMVQNHVASGELVPVLSDWSSDPLPIHVVYPPNRHLSNKTRVFVDWVADLFARSDLMQRRSTLPLRVAA
ncbi:MAG TPA: LysR family transcriptional regulator [Ideonella sp.]|nr:LysR family transcriptional regulator [Ideonella sp.]